MPEQVTPTPEEAQKLLRTEASTLLDFCCGPLYAAGKTNYLNSWVTGASPETVAERGFFVVHIALLLQQLCKERGITPYDSLDGTRVALQALYSSAFSLNNLLVLDLPEGPVFEGLKIGLAPAFIERFLSPLAPVMADGCSKAWVTQTMNSRNPVTQLVMLAELTHSTMWSLNKASSGNRNAHKLCINALSDMWELSKDMDTELRQIAQAIVLTVGDLIGFVPEETVNANDS